MRQNRQSSTYWNNDVACQRCPSFFSILLPSHIYVPFFVRGAICLFGYDFIHFQNRHSVNGWTETNHSSDMVDYYYELSERNYRKKWKKCWKNWMGAKRTINCFVEIGLNSSSTYTGRQDERFFVESKMRVITTNVWQLCSKIIRNRQLDTLHFRDWLYIICFI